MNWKKFKEEKPSEGEEVLAYHPSWIDEDFNPRGIRIGFWNGGDDFKSAHWWAAARAGCSCQAERLSFTKYPQSPAAK